VSTFERAKLKRERLAGTFERKRIRSALNNAQVQKRAPAPFLLQQVWR
jgi:hypothetical protein